MTESDTGRYQSYVAWYNPATGQWEQLTTVSIDTVNHTITASVNHFSTFAVLAALSKTSTTASTAVGTATSNATQRHDFECYNQTIG